MLLRAKRIPRGPRAAATTISGGNGVLLVDHGAAHGLQWPEYGANTRAALADFLPKMATTGNPTDVSNALVGKAALFQRCVETIAGDDNIDIVVPTYTMKSRWPYCGSAAATTMPDSRRSPSPRAACRFFATRWLA
jgi:acyl-CoA synthetase (NDP forming)